MSKFTIRRHIVFAFVLLTGILMNACSSSNSVVSNRLIQKRKYTKGWHLNFKKNERASKETKEAEPLNALSENHGYQNASTSETKSEQFTEVSTEQRHFNQSSPSYERLEQDYYTEDELLGSSEVNLKDQQLISENTKDKYPKSEKDIEQPANNNRLIGLILICAGPVLAILGFFLWFLLFYVGIAALLIGLILFFTSSSGKNQPNDDNSDDSSSSLPPPNINNGYLVQAKKEYKNAWIYTVFAIISILGGIILTFNYGGLLYAVVGIFLFVMAVAFYILLFIYLIRTIDNLIWHRYDKNATMTSSTLGFFTWAHVTIASLVAILLFWIPLWIVLARAKRTRLSMQ